ncbi:MAG: N-formylglutamate amidohydrolase [Clostridia bacterium]|nr:N-formylglutamate amidohydrolase [Clostridia bacterium]
MQRTDSPLLVHIPHASTTIPETERERFCIPDLDAELLNMTDLYTDELFEGTYDSIRFPVSRLVCDPERFRDDESEDMSRVGMGAVYARTSCGEVLRQVNARERERILRRYYDPHHRVFTERVSEKLRIYGRCLIIDAHSFPAIPLPYEPDQDRNRPDFCIGTDPFHTQPGLRNACESVLRGGGYSVSVNRPFSGAIVPMSFYRTDRRVQSVMIEVNRKLYVEPDGRRKEAFGDVRRILQDLLHALDLRYTETDR